ncbi:hypothetical protein BJV82DRAFT_674274 [Fennellomyces sp. T-0311]|nr:hypothetical protein BJV82DRAFT_674274 [Fennellomyces sp. T-0311]
MVEGRKPSTLQRLARWQTTAGHEKKHTKATSLASLEAVHHDDLKRGALYIVKIHHVSITLFEGYYDDMCVFQILRSDADPLRWSEGRYLPGDFEAFDAFDDAGNPPVHLWTRYLRVEVPLNWFAMFEEARRKQREWNDVPPQLPENHVQTPPLLTSDHQRIIQDYGLQSSSVPVSSAAASTNIVDPAGSFLSSVSSLPMDSRPLGYIMDYDGSSPTFPRPPSTVPNREELRRHLQDDLTRNAEEKDGRRRSSVSIEHHLRESFSLPSNTKRNSIQSFFSKHSQK